MLKPENNPLKRKNSPNEKKPAKETEIDGSASSSQTSDEDSERTLSEIMEKNEAQPSSKSEGSHDPNKPCCKHSDPNVNKKGRNGGPSYQCMEE